MVKLKLNMERTCQVCGASFRPATLESFYCSPQCSKVAWNRKKYEERTKEMREHLKKLGETSTSFLSITQIIETYGVSRSSIYRWMRKGELPYVIVGKKSYRIRKTDLEEKLFPVRESQSPKGPRLYNMEPEACYTIGEICKKYKLDDSSVWAHIRKYSIPTRQIGPHVYAPKEDIDQIYGKK